MTVFKGRKSNKMKKPLSEQSKRYRRVLKILLLSTPVLYALSLASFFLPNSDGALGTFLFSISIIVLIVGIFGQFGAWIADTAESKGRSWKAFFWLSLLISPLITGLIVATIRGNESINKVQSQGSMADELSKLESLYKSGAIGEDEYKKAKSKILGI